MANRQQIAEQCVLPREVWSREPTHCSMKIRFGTLAVRGPPQLAAGRTRGGDEARELALGDDVGVAAVAERRFAPGVEFAVPRGEHHRADVSSSSHGSWSKSMAWAGQTVSQERHSAQPPQARQRRASATASSSPSRDAPRPRICVAFRRRRRRHRPAPFGPAGGEVGVRHDGRRSDRLPDLGPVLPA